MTDWIEWVYTDEKPYPETLETKVIVKFRDDIESTITWSVGFWHGGGNWRQLDDSEDIIAYKVVSE